MINNVSASTYSVTVHSNLPGCSATGSVIVNNSNGPTVSFSGIVNTTCSGGSDGAATANPSGGTAPYTYSWQPSGQITQTATGLSAGSHTLTVTDATGCSSIQPVTITQSSQIQANLTSTNVTCFSQCNGIASVNPSGGTGPYTFLWQPGGQITASISSLCAGLYTVTITDANGCIQTGTTTVTVNPLPIATITSNAVNGIYTLDPNGQLCFYGPATGVTTWNWTLQPGNSNLQSPCVTVTAADTGSYCAQLTVLNIYGCTDTANICLEITNVFYSIPNVFTPNGDGTNDAFIITNGGMKSVHCIIYDRWGVLIYEWDSPLGYWDGRTTSGKEAVDGVYYWTADMVDYAGKQYGDHGFVHLIRGGPK